MTFLITLLYLLGVVGILYLLYIASFLKQFIELAIGINKLNGAPAVPVLGNLPQLIGTPAQIFHNMRHMIRVYGPVFRAWIGVHPCINFTCPDHVEALIGSSKHNTKGLLYELFQPWLSTGLLTSQGAKWFHRRKILTPSFHFNILVQFVDIFNKHSVTLVEQLREQGRDGVEVSSIFSEYTLRIICESSMGISLPHDLDEKTTTTYMNSVKKFGSTILQRVMNPLILPDVTFAMSKHGATSREVCKYLHDFSSKVIETRCREYEKSRGREKAVDDDGDAEVPRKKRMAMLDMLLGVKYNDGAIDDEGIREEVDTFMFGGLDTTSISLGYSLMLLACNKHCQDKIYEEILNVLGDRMPTYKDLTEMEYLRRCIKESLRLYPSVPMISRNAEDGLTADGHPVPEGCWVNVWIFDMHRDKKYFPDPEKFDPDRFLPENTADRHPFVYIPFSAGPRNCIGQRFAMLEMEACLIAVLRNFTLEPIDTPETIELIPDLVLRTVNGIKVKFVPRS